MIEIRNVPGPGKKNLETLIKGLNGAEGKVGWFSGQRYRDGTPVAQVAAWQEYGTGKIPPRSFMRTTQAEQQGAWAALVAKGAKAVLKGTHTPIDVMQALGDTAAGDIRKKISNITAPPLSPLTLLVRKYKLGLIGDMNPPGKVGGRLLGILWDRYTKGEIDTSGVSAKPLIDPAGADSGLLMASVTSQVTTQ